MSLVWPRVKVMTSFPKLLRTGIKQPRGREQGVDRNKMTGWSTYWENVKHNVME